MNIFFKKKDVFAKTLTGLDDCPLMVSVQVDPAGLNGAADGS